MALETPLFLQAVGGDTAITFSAQQARTLIDALAVGTGVVYRTDLAVAQRAAGANFSVDVAAGHCIIGGTSVSDQGKYVCQNTATYNLAITGAPGSGTRYDRVYAQVRDKQADGGSAYDWVIDKVTGTVGAGLPALPANAISLAQIGPIISTTTSITTSLITDLRSYPQNFPQFLAGSGNGKIKLAGVDLGWGSVTATVDASGDIDLGAAVAAQQGWTSVYMVVPWSGDNVTGDRTNMVFGKNTDIGTYDASWKVRQRVGNTGAVVSNGTTVRYDYLAIGA